jgi:hypothetical protein
MLVAKPVARYPMVRNIPDETMAVLQLKRSTIALESGPE